MTKKESEEIREIRKIQEEERKRFQDEVKLLEEEIGKTILVRPSNKKDSKRKKFDRARVVNGMFDVKGKWKRWRLKLQPEKSYLINMELRNGNYSTFVVYTAKNTFTYMKGEYIIDDEMKYYDVSSGLYCLDYHQDLSLPIKRKIPFNDIRKVITATGLTEVETAINPISLKHFQESNLIQGVMKGQELDEAIKQLKLLAIISAVASAGIAIYLIVKSGAIQGLV